MDNVKYMTDTWKNFMGKRVRGGRPKILADKEMLKYLITLRTSNTAIEKIFNALRNRVVLYILKKNELVTFCKNLNTIASSLKLKDMQGCCMGFRELFIREVLRSKGVKVKQYLLRSILVTIKGTSPFNYVPIQRRKFSNRSAKTF